MDVVKTAEVVQRRVEDRFRRVGKGRYGRVLRMARKPTSEEYTRVIQVTGLGILAIGFLGFLIYLLMTQLPPYLRTLFP